MKTYMNHDSPADQGARAAIRDNRHHKGEHKGNPDPACYNCNHELISPRHDTTALRAFEKAIDRLEGV